MAAGGDGRSGRKENLLSRSGVFLFLGVLLSCACSACAPQEGQQPGEKSTIIFKHAKHPRYAYLAALIRRFEDKNPNIHVVEEVLPASTDEQHQYYVINLAARTGDFDVLDMDVIWVPEFARAGWLQDLSTDLSAAELSPLHSQALSADRLDGKLYGVPWFVDVGVLYYRRDLLTRYGEKPPTTYNDLVQTAQKVLEREKDPRLFGFVWQGLQYEGLACTALEFIRGNGGDILDEQGRVAVDRPAAVAAMQFMHDLIYKYRVTPQLVTTLNEESCRIIFQSGRAVFMRNWPYVWRLVNQPDSPVAGRIGVIPIPHFPGHASAPTLGGFHLGVNNFSGHKREAVEFLRFMIREDVQRDILMNVGVLPAHMRVYQDPEIRRKMPFVAELYPLLGIARARPVTPYYLMISQVLQPEFSAVIAGIRGPEAAMRTAASQIEHLMGNT